MKKTLQEEAQKNRHSLIRYGIPVFLFAALYFLFIAPSRARIDEMKFKAENCKAASRGFHSLLKKEALIREDNKKTRLLLDSAGTGLGVSLTAPQLVSDVLSLAKAGKISLTSIESNGLVRGETFDDALLKLGVAGGFRETVRFMHGLERAGHSFALSGLLMRSDEKSLLRTTVTLQALVRHEDK